MLIWVYYGSVIHVSLSIVPVISRVHFRCLGLFGSPPLRCPPPILRYIVLKSYIALGKLGFDCTLENSAIKGKIHQGYLTN